ncbi:MAG: hypothetical protein IKX88_07395 [Thermoguttaceae bacterium]|nr:hypothetical protein [Thermoguttaceae bacterium]MBR5758402.1 hypothetical protein [Thermoguttaceae bacterium]
MTAVNRWSEDGVVRKNSLLRAKLTLTAKSASSGAIAVVGDYYEFNCKSKTLPCCAKAPTWSDVTDNPSEPVGYAYAGKPERLETIELTTRTPLQLTYDELIEHLKGGDVFTLSYVYDDPHESSVYTITLTNCQIIGVEPAAGGNDSGSQTTIRILPEGGSSENMPAVTVAARVGN